MRKGIVFGGAAVLAALLAGITIAAAPHPGGPGSFATGGERLKAALGLTDDQLGQLKKLRLEDSKTRIRSQADLRIARLELKEMLTAPTVDEKAVRAKGKEVEQLVAAMAHERVEHAIALRHIVNAEQAQKLMEMHERRRQAHGDQPFWRQRGEGPGFGRGQGPGPGRGEPGPGRGPHPPQDQEDDGPGGLS